LHEEKEDRHETALSILSNLQNLILFNIHFIIIIVLYRIVL